MNRKDNAVYISNVNKVRSFLEQSYLGNVRFSDITSLIDIGECNFKKYFKKETGFSVMQYFKRYKIQKSMELIKADALRLRKYPFFWDMIPYTAFQGNSKR